MKKNLLQNYNKISMNHIFFWFEKNYLNNVYGIKYNYSKYFKYHVHVIYMEKLLKIFA